MKNYMIAFTFMIPLLFTGCGSGDVKGNDSIPVVDVEAHQYKGEVKDVVLPISQLAAKIPVKLDIYDIELPEPIGLSNVIMDESGEFMITFMGYKLDAMKDIDDFTAGFFGGIKKQGGSLKEVDFKAHEEYKRCYIVTLNQEKRLYHIVLSGDTAWVVLAQIPSSEPHKDPLLVQIISSIKAQ